MFLFCVYYYIHIKSYYVVKLYELSIKNSILSCWSSREKQGMWEVANLPYVSEVDVIWGTRIIRHIYVDEPANILSWDWALKLRLNTLPIWLSWPSGLKTGWCPDKSISVSTISGSCPLDRSVVTKKLDFAKNQGILFILYSVIY